MTAAIAGQLALTSGNTLLLYETPVPEKIVTPDAVPENPPENALSSLPLDFGYESLFYNSYGRLDRPRLKGLIIDFRY